MLTHQRGNRSAGTGAWSPRGRRPVRTGRPTDDPFGRQPVEQRGRLYPNEARYRDSTLGYDNLMAIPDPLQPVAEVGTEFADGYVHTPTVQDALYQTYAKVQKGLGRGIAAGALPKCPTRQAARWMLPSLLIQLAPARRRRPATQLRRGVHR